MLYKLFFVHSAYVCHLCIRCAYFLVGKQEYNNIKNKNISIYTIVDRYIDGCVKYGEVNCSMKKKKKNSLKKGKRKQL